MLRWVKLDVLTASKMANLEEIEQARTQMVESQVGDAGKGLTIRALREGVGNLDFILRAVKKHRRALGRGMI